MLSRDNITKALGSANKVIAGHAYWAILSLFKFNLVNLSTLEAFYYWNKENKIAKVWEKVAEFTFVFITGIMEEPNRDLKEENIKIFEEVGEKMSKDANGLVWQWAKKVKSSLDALKVIIRNGHKDKDDSIDLKMPLEV